MAYGSGDQIVIGWATEVTPGTAVAATNFLPLDIGSAAFDFNPNRGEVDVSAGTPFVTGALVDRQGKGTGSAKMKVYPTLGQDFLAACGLTSPIRASISMTITVSYTGTGEAIQYPGCRCIRKVVSSSAATDVEASLSFEFTGQSIPVAELAAPTLTAEDPYIWTDADPFTLISGATSQAVEQVTITIEEPHAAGYGNHKVALPSILVNSTIKAMWDARLFFDSTNIAEYNAMVTPGGTPGAAIFSWTKGGHVLTFDFPNNKYKQGPISTPSNGIDLIDLQGGAYSPTHTAAGLLLYSAT